MRVSGVAATDLAIIADVWIYQESPKGRQSTAVTLWTVERMARNPAIQQQYSITFSPLSRPVQLGAFVTPQQVIDLFPSLKGRFRVTEDGRIVRTFWSGKVGMTIKIGGLVVGGLLLRGLLGYFAARVYARYAQQSLDEQFKQVRSRIDKDILSHKEDALKIVAGGGQAFAVTVMKIWTNSDYVGGQGASMPVVEYHGLLAISPTKTERHESETKHYVGNSTDVDVYVTSTPIEFDKDTVEMYKDYRKAIAWYEERINATNHKEAVELHKELMGMKERMRRILEA